MPGSMILFLILVWGAGLYYFFVMSPAARTKGPQHKQKGIIIFVVGVLAIYLLTSLSSINEPGSGGVVVPGHKWATKRYWTPVTSQTKKIAPLNDPNEKFLTCTPRFSGLNNERMVLELAFAFALTLNRTLVLNPPFWVDHLGSTNKDLSNFFDFNDLAKGVRVISYTDFAKKMKWDKLPSNLRDLDNFMHEQSDTLVVSMPERGKSNIYNVFAWPQIPAENTDAHASLKQFAGPHKRNFYDVVTDPKLLSAKVVHYDTRTLFGHFYNAIWYEDFDLYQDLLFRVKNFVHYRSEWFERAERIIKQLGPFSAIHIRRGDFQYKTQKGLSYATIFENTKNLYKEGETLWLATDETDMDKLEREELPVFRDRYKVKLLKDYKYLIEDEIPEYTYGIIETIICSYARVFVGTKASTYSGYIQRLRGYYSDTINPNIYFTDTKWLSPITYDWARWPMEGGNKCPSDTGGYCFIWSWEFDDAWKYARDIHA